MLEVNLESNMRVFVQVSHMESPKKLKKKTPKSNPTQTSASTFNKPSDNWNKWS